jgi:hypothetical protein
MRVPEEYYDEIFDFKGEWDLPSRCGLRVLMREKPVVIVTELYQDNPGTSVTAAGKSLAEQICRAKNLEIDKITYLECNPDTGSKLSFYDEEYYEVDFTSRPEPVYRRIDALEREKLTTNHTNI